MVRPTMVRLFMVKPRTYIAVKVEIIEVGIEIALKKVETILVGILVVTLVEEQAEEALVVDQVEEVLVVDLAEDQLIL